MNVNDIEKRIEKLERLIREHQKTHSLVLIAQQTIVSAGLSENDFNFQKDRVQMLAEYTEIINLIMDVMTLPMPTPLKSRLQFLLDTLYALKLELEAV